MKWIVAAFFAIVFAVLSYNGFIANDLSKFSTTNRLIAMLAKAYNWLFTTIGSMPTGALFAVCAVGVLVLAAQDGKKPKTF